MPEHKVYDAPQWASVVLAALAAVLAAMFCFGGRL
jgi:hypothetical protein